MTRTSSGGVLLVLGLVSVAAFTSVLDLPGDLSFILALVLGVVPATVGAAVAWAGWRASSKTGDAGTDRLAGIKDQIVWRAVAQGGRVTVAQAAAHVGLPEIQIEHALIALVAEGRAAVEPGAEGEIVYRIDSPV